MINRFSSWDDGKPDDISGNCLLMRTNGTYTNEDCNTPQPYFCERKMGILANFELIILAVKFSLTS